MTFYAKLIRSGGEDHIVAGATIENAGQVAGVIKHARGVTEWAVLEEDNNTIYYIQSSHCPESLYRMLLLLSINSSKKGKENE